MAINSTPTKRIHIRFTSMVLVASAAAVINSCRPPADKTEKPGEQATHVAELHQNNLPADKSSLLNSQRNSPIHWQNWDKEIFKRAQAEKKTVFALIGSGTDACTLGILNRLNNSPISCTLLNDHHVNVLIDSNIHPDIEYYVSRLCIASRIPASSPLLVWFSYEGNPVSWTPVGSNSAQDIDELLGRMSNTVYQLWNDDPDYVLKNSRDDIARRMKSILPKPVEAGADATLLTLGGIRRAASLFDPTSRTIDGAGNLAPARYIDLMVKAATHPDTPAAQRARYIKIASQTADNLLVQGLLDPLDGGVFKGTQSTTGTLPEFTKTLRAQALSMKALFNLCRATGNQRYLDTATSIAAYAEKHLALKDGGYILGIAYGPRQAQDNPCVWTLEEIEAALTPDELAVANAAFGLRGLGNVPPSDDPDKSYFRKNTLTWKTGRKELAAKLSIPLASLDQKLQSITKKLAKIRTEKPDKPTVENASSAGSTAHLVSAYVAGFRATGNRQHLDKAKSIMSLLRKNFTSPDGKLHQVRYGGTTGEHPATAGTRTLVCQAALDLHEATLDPGWLQYARQLHKNMNLALADKQTHYLSEYNGEGYPSPCKTETAYTIKSLDNDCTWSLAFANARRLGFRFADKELNTRAASLNPILLRVAKTTPIPGIDYLTIQAATNTPRVYVKSTAPTELLQAAHSKPCQIILVQDGGSYPELGDQAGSLPGNAAIVVSNGETSAQASTAAELSALLD